MLRLLNALFGAKTPSGVDPEDYLRQVWGEALGRLRLLAENTASADRG